MFDLFKIRNLVEAILLTLPPLYLCMILFPLSLTPKLITTIALMVPVGGSALVRISDDSLTRRLDYWWHWRQARRTILLRGEVKK